MTGRPEVDARAGREPLLLLALVLAALLPSLGTLGAPWLAEDASVLARMASEGPWADWNRPWFGMEIVRFWRPLVSLTWGAQFALTGIDPFALRLLNLVLHAGCVLFAFGATRRLGGSLLGGSLAGLWVAWFPAQGGTVTWLSGRTDLLVGFWLLASVFSVLGARSWLAAPCVFLAASAKEFGFLAPLWCVLALGARGESWRDALRKALPAFAAVLAAGLWRRLALGSFAGGYAGEWPGLATGLGGAARVLGAHGWTLATGLPLALLFAGGCLARTLRVRHLAWLGAALAALVPLHPLLADGLLEPQNQRLLFVPTLALALLLGSASPARTVPVPVLGALVLLLLAGRARAAWRDTHAWSHAAEVSSAAIEATRTRVATLAPGAAPVLVRDLPSALGPAYALGFGVAERFAAPFPGAPRPVWPWRLVFVDDARRARAPLCRARDDGLVLPLDEPLVVPELTLRADGAPAASLALDERIFPRGEDRSNVLTLSGGPAGAALELLVVSPLGYEVFPAGALDPAGEARASLRTLLALSNGIATVSQTLAQAADLGARRGFLEFRAQAADGTILGATRWLELEWPADLPRR